MRGGGTLHAYGHKLCMVMVYIPIRISYRKWGGGGLYLLYVLVCAVLLYRRRGYVPISGGSPEDGGQKSGRGQPKSELY